MHLSDMLLQCFQDEMVPQKHMQELHQACKSARCNLVSLPAHHMDAYCQCPQEYWSEFQKFLQSTLNSSMWWKELGFKSNRNHQDCSSFEGGGLPGNFAVGVCKSEYIGHGFHCIDHVVCIIIMISNFVWSLYYHCLCSSGIFLRGSWRCLVIMIDFTSVEIPCNQGTARSKNF